MSQSFVIRVFSMVKRDFCRYRHLAKEGTWIIIGKIAVVLGSLALVRVLTGFLTPAEYGQLALSLTLVTLFGQVVFGGLGAGIARYYAIAAEKSDLHGYLAASRKLLIYATITSLAIGFVVMMALGLIGYSHWISVALVATLLAVLSGYNGTLNSIQNAARQRVIVAMHGGLNAWLKIGLAVALLLLLGKNSENVILGFALSALLVTLSQLAFLRKTIPHLGSNTHKPDAGQWGAEVWRFSWPFSIFGVFTWMQQASDRWALGLFGSTHDVGFYAVVFQLGYTPIALALGLSTTFLSPILYHRAGDATSAQRNHDVHQIVWRITTVVLLLTGLAVIATAVLHEWLFGLLVAPEFRRISYLLPWVIFAGGVFSAGQMLSLKLMSEMKAQKLLVPKITTALFGLGSNLLGAALAGIEGVVAALVAFSMVYLAWVVLLSYTTPVIENESLVVDSHFSK